MLTPKLSKPIEILQLRTCRHTRCSLDGVVFADDPQPAMEATANPERNATAPAPVLSGHVTRTMQEFPWSALVCESPFQPTNMQFIVQLSQIAKYGRRQQGGTANFCLNSRGITKPGKNLD